MDDGRLTNCQRCGTTCTIDPVRGSKATMLKRGAKAEGLCVNCAAHDWLRNTYPVNLLLAQSGPRTLAFHHIQEQFAGLMKMANSDARPDEIDWQRIIENWELPFSTPLRPSAANPVNQAELDREPRRFHRRMEAEEEDLKSDHLYE